MKKSRCGRSLFMVRNLVILLFKFSLSEGYLKDGVPTFFPSGQGMVWFWLICVPEVMWSNPTLTRSQQALVKCSEFLRLYHNTVENQLVVFYLLIRPWTMKSHDHGRVNHMQKTTLASIIQSLLVQLSQLLAVVLPVLSEAKNNPLLKSSFCW